jgi:glycosyltransferase involved in cell wall biosynthesis
MIKISPQNILSPKAVASTVPFSRFIANLVRKYNIEIIHAHFAYPEGFAGFLARRLVKVPFVLTLHGYDILTEPSIKYGVRLEKRFDSMIRKVLAEVDKVFVASEHVYKAAKSAGCPPEHLVLLPNGVDIERFNPRLDGSLIRKMLGVADRPVVFTLRWHEPKNGIEYLIRAVPHVLREVPEAVFVIGSDGPLMGYHESLAENLGIDDHIMFAGRIPRKDLPSYYAASDLFVIPSVVEAFGLVTVEAMACGKPVIGANVGGIPEIIVDGVNGFLIEPKNPEKIAEKVVVLLENPKLRRKMGQNGRKLAEEKFDIQKRVRKIVSVYERLL